MTATMYLVLKPQGGINDILCTIYRCYLYCKKFNRKLIIHTNNAHENVLFADGVENYFHCNDPIICLGIQRGSEIADLLIDLLDVNLDNNPWISGLTDGRSRRVITRLDRGFSERVILYQSYGGGYIGINTLGILSLTNIVRESIRAMVDSLPASYNAVHCRNTDYQSDISQVSDLVRALSANKKAIYFGTDSKETLLKIVTELPEVTIINKCSSFASANDPIHHSPNARSRQTVLDIFTDLSALILAENFGSTCILNPSDPYINKSGFSILVEKLRELPRQSLLDYFYGNINSSNSEDQKEVSVGSGNKVRDPVELNASPGESNHVIETSLKTASLQITIPTYKRQAEFKRLISQIVIQVNELDEKYRSNISIKIFENPSDQTPGKIEFVKSVTIKCASIELKCNESNIGGDANIEQAYNGESKSDFNWVIGDDEQILPNSIHSILEYLSNNQDCGLLILHDPFSYDKPDPRVIAQEKWNNYNHFANWLCNVNPFLLISHSLISLNVIRVGIFNVQASKQERSTFAKRAGLIGSYAHMVGIITGLEDRPDLSVCFLPSPTVDASHRSPHEEVVFGWVSVRRLWHHYLSWLAHRFGLDYEQIRLHSSMRDVFPKGSE